MEPSTTCSLPASAPHLQGHLILAIPFTFSAVPRPGALPSACCATKPWQPGCCAAVTMFLELLCCPAWPWLLLDCGLSGFGAAGCAAGLLWGLWRGTDDTRLHQPRYSLLGPSNHSCQTPLAHIALQAALECGPRPRQPTLTLLGPPSCGELLQPTMLSFVGRPSFLGRCHMAAPQRGRAALTSSLPRGH